MQRLKDNKVYRIIDAKPIEDGVRLNIGDTTLITQYADIYDLEKGYKYNIAVGENFRIPLNFIDDKAPVITSPNEAITGSAGKLLSFMDPSSASSVRPISSCSSRST